MRSIKSSTSGIIEPSRNLEEEYFNIGSMDLTDSTGTGTVTKPEVNEDISSESEKLHIRYMEFGKYRIGLIEKETHEVVGIQSVEERKKLYSDEQLSKRFNYWDVEKYYKKD